MPSFTAMLASTVPAKRQRRQRGAIASGRQPARVTIAASTSIDPDDQQQHGNALLAEPARSPARGHRRDGDEHEEAERRQRSRSDCRAAPAPRMLGALR